MTREELKKVLASKENRLAGEAIEAIRSGSPLADLRDLVSAGASDRYVTRDALHPRSRYRVVHVLDTCFDSKFGAIRETRTTSASGVQRNEVLLGHIPAAAGRAQHFAFLLDCGFSPGSNGYRGDLFPAILKSCFYRSQGEGEVAMELAKILVAKGKVDIQKFAENNYEWTGSPEKLTRVMELGARPSPAMLDCALRYCACAKGPDDPEGGRADVIRALLDTGVAPSRPLGNSGSSQDQRRFLESAGLAARIESSSPARPLPVASLAAPAPVPRRSALAR